MRAKSHQKQKAVEFRKKGHTLREIADSLGVSKSSVSLWVRNVGLSSSAMARISRKRIEARERSSETRRTRTRRLLANAQCAAEEAVSQVRLTSQGNRILCSMIYWCEGTKSRNDRECSFTNSDPLLIKTFLSLLRSGFEIEERRLRICMHLHSYHDESEQMEFWSAVTGVPHHQFIQSYKKENGGTNIKDGYPGCIQVRYYDVRVARQLHALAREYMKSL